VKLKAGLEEICWGLFLPESEEERNSQLLFLLSLSLSLSLSFFSFSFIREYKETVYGKDVTMTLLRGAVSPFVKRKDRLV